MSRLATGGGGLLHCCCIVLLLVWGCGASPEEAAEWKRSWNFEHPWNYEEPPLSSAYIALQAWKSAITGDPQGITSTWVGDNVCLYRGIFCQTDPYDQWRTIVAGIDLNHGELEGALVPELGLLTDLALFHINTNLFTGAIPSTFSQLVTLCELDLSNNKFYGTFPSVVLELPSLIYLDLRFNLFYGALPPLVFDKKLDALFVNNNAFDCPVPDNLGNSPVSVVVLANNHFTGEIPVSVGMMSNTLNELVFLNNDLSGFLPPQIGNLLQVDLFDVSFNNLTGPLPPSISGMTNLIAFNVADNYLQGNISTEVCGLPAIQNLTFADNYFSGESDLCFRIRSSGVIVNDADNCIPNLPNQKPPAQCDAYFASLPPIPEFHL